MVEEEDDDDEEAVEEEEEVEEVEDDESVILLPADPEDEPRQAMLSLIAQGDAPRTDGGVEWLRNYRVRKDPSIAQMRRRLEAAGEEWSSVVVFDSTPASLGIEGDHHWTKQLLELMRSLPDEEVVILRRSNPNVWYFVLSVYGHEALVEEAGRTSPTEFSSRARHRQNTTMMDKAVLRALEAKGIHVCTTCTMALLKPSDPEFEKKKALIEEVCKSQTRLSECGSFCCNCEA